MAKSTRNLLTQGFSGKLGVLVFRQCNGMTIMASAPRKSTKAPTAKQLEQRMQFRRASAWARGALQDQETAARYAVRSKREKKSSYALAMRDYLRKDRLEDLEKEFACL